MAAGLQERRDDLLGRLARRPRGAARTLLQPHGPVPQIPVNPLIPGLPAHLVHPAQLAEPRLLSDSDSVAGNDSCVSNVLAGYALLWKGVMRPQGSPAELERRRLRAIELLQRDTPVHVVAERLGVDRRSVRRWKRTHRRQGRAGLRARPAPGRPPKLTPRQRQRLARLVIAGPEAAGYRRSLWTCRRLVHAHPGRVRRPLPPRSRRSPASRVWLQPASSAAPGPGAR